MCTYGCLDFVSAHLRADEVKGRTVLEVGSLDVNGSVRPLVAAFGPASYVGVDMQAGPGVDVICDATELAARFGSDRFDLLLSTELLEHVRDWRAVISQFKRVLKPYGRLLVTTRSRGFPYHAYPFDFWRFEPADVQRIFADFKIEAVSSDPASPGVFLKAQKPASFVEGNLGQVALFSMITNARALTVTDAQIATFHQRQKWRRRVRAPERFIRTMRDKLRR